MYCSLACSVVNVDYSGFRESHCTVFPPQWLCVPYLPRCKIKLSIHGPIPMSISLWDKLFLDELVRACLDEGGTLPHTSRSKAPDCLCLFRRENLVDLGSWKLEACRAGPDEELIYSWSRLVISGWICAVDGFFFSPEPAQETGKLPDTWMRLPR